MNEISDELRIKRKEKIKSQFRELNAIGGAGKLERINL